MNYFIKQKILEDLMILNEKKTTEQYRMEKLKKKIGYDNKTGTGLIGGKRLPINFNNESNFRRKADTNEPIEMNLDKKIFSKKFHHSYPEHVFRHEEGHYLASKKSPEDYEKESNEIVKKSIPYKKGTTSHSDIPEEVMANNNAAKHLGSTRIARNLQRRAHLDQKDMKKLKQNKKTFFDTGIDAGWYAGNKNTEELRKYKNDIIKQKSQNKKDLKELADDIHAKNFLKEFQNRNMEEKERIYNHHLKSQVTFRKQRIQDARYERAMLPGYKNKK